MKIKRETLVRVGHDVWLVKLGYFGKTDHRHEQWVTKWESHLEKFDILLMSPGGMPHVVDMENGLFYPLDELLTYFFLPENDPFYARRAAQCGYPRHIQELKDMGIWDEARKRIEAKSMELPPEKRKLVAEILRDMGELVDEILRNTDTSGRQWNDEEDEFDDDDDLIMFCD